MRLSLLLVLAGPTTARPLFLSPIRNAIEKQPRFRNENHIPFTHSSTNAMMIPHIPRGGAGPLDPAVAAKCMAALAIVQGFLMHSAPKKAAEQYGVQASHNNAFLQFWNQQIGTQYLIYGLQIFALVHKKVPVYNAMRGLFLANVYNDLRAILDDSWKNNVSKNGDNVGIWPAVILNACFCYALTQDYKKNAALVSVALNTILGLVFVLAPSAGLAMWKGDASKISTAGRMALKSFGFSVVSFAALFYPLIDMDASATQAAGYGSLLFAVFHLWTVLDDDFKGTGLSTSAMLVWMVLHLIVAGSALL